jgi:FkbM family methyltransferase
MLTRLLPWLYAKLRVGRWLHHPFLEGIYLTLLFAYKRHVEDPFAGLARRRPDLFRDGHILDVGANVGYTASVFAAVVPTEYRVYAFEPEPLNLRRLKRVIRGRHLDDRVVVIESAVGDTNGEVDLLINESHPGDHRVTAEAENGPTVHVAMTTLDDFVTRHCVSPVRFVKIDVQGLELAVSRGMKSLIDANRRLAVAFEYQQPSAQTWGYDAADLVHFYSERGFNLYVLNHRGEMLDASEHQIASAHERRGYIDFLALRDGDS